MLTYSVEPWAAYYREAAPLWRANYEALGDKRMKLQPDTAAYEYLDNVGQLQVMVARNDGVMVGHMIFVVRTHTHFTDTLCGFEDVYFLDPAHRKGRNGINLIKKSLAALKARGVKMVFVNSDLSADVGKLLRFVGLKPVNELYSAWIGD